MNTFTGTKKTGNKIETKKSVKFISTTTNLKVKENKREEEAESGHLNVPKMGV